MKFIIFGGGDHSVGIPSSEWTCEIQGNYEFDEDTIQLWKDMLSEMDDNNANVLTEKEYDEMIEHENKSYD